jgi:hypothetical protein
MERTICKSKYANKGRGAAANAFRVRGKSQGVECVGVRPSQSPGGGAVWMLGTNVYIMCLSFGAPFIKGL